MQKVKWIDIGDIVPTDIVWEVQLEEPKRSGARLMTYKPHYSVRIIHSTHLLLILHHTTIIRFSQSIAETPRIDLLIPQTKLRTQQYYHNQPTTIKYIPK